MHGIEENDTMGIVVNTEKDNYAPWHGIGSYVGQTMNLSEAMEAAPTFFSPIRMVPAIDPFGTPDPLNNYAVTDDDFIVGRGLGQQATPMQGIDLWERLESFLDVLPGDPMANVIGTLFGRTRRFCTVALPEVGASLTDATGDEHTAYLVTVDSVDGSYALTSFLTLVRALCNNSFKAGLASASQKVRVRHTKTVSERYDTALSTLAVITAESSAYAETMARLQAVELTLEDIDRFVNEMIPVPAERGKDQAADKQTSLKSNILHSAVIGDDLRQSGYGVFQTATHWAEHVNENRWRTDTPENERRMRSTLFGGPTETFQRKALALLTN